MTPQEKLQEIREFIVRMHDEAMNVLEDAEEKEEDSETSDDVIQCEAVVNITSQLLEILNK